LNYFSIIRNAITKDIILRWAGGDDWEMQASEGEPASFVTQSLAVPMQWVHEATAIQQGYVQDWAKVRDRFHV